MRSFIFSAVLAVVATQYTDANVTAIAAAEIFEAGTIGVMCGADWLGDDLGSVKASDPARCPVACFLEYQDAAVQTWTNHEGGTCWCKKNQIGYVYRTSKIVPNDGAITHGLQAFRSSDPPGRYIAIYQNMDMPGYDIGNIRNPDAGQCVKDCENSPGCFAFTFTTYNGGTCWLKSRGSALVPIGNGYNGGSGIIVRRDTNQCRPL